MDLADHFRTILTNWWRILVVAVVVAAATYFYSSSRPDVYRASTLLNVAPTEAFTDTNVNEVAIDFRTTFYARLAKTPSVARSAVESEKLDITWEEALGRYSAQETDTTGFLLIRADGPTRQVSAALARGVANAMLDKVKQEQEDSRNSQRNELLARIDAINKALQTIDQTEAPEQYSLLKNAVAVNRAAIIDLDTQGLFGISIAAPALAAPDPVAPTPARDTTLAFLASLVLAAETTVLWRYVSDRFSRADESTVITEYTGLPVLAMIPRGRGPEVVEAFRTLRTNLMFLEGAGRPRTIAVVSPNPGAGKSFCALHLAESACAVDASVVLIDGDLRRPVLHSRVHVDREPGLSNALRGADLSKCLHPVEGMPSLELMPSGSAVSDTVGVLSGRAFRQILDSLDTAELIVVDTPPGTVYADARAVAAQCDGTLLVVDAKSTRRRAVKEMIETLERTGAMVIGIAVNGVQVSRRDTYERY